MEGRLWSPLTEPPIIRIALFLNTSRDYIENVYKAINSLNLGYFLRTITMKYLEENPQLKKRQTLFIFGKVADLTIERIKELSEFFDRSIFFILDHEAISAEFDNYRVVYLQDQNREVQLKKYERECENLAPFVVIDLERRDLTRALNSLEPLTMICATEAPRLNDWPSKESLKIQYSSTPKQRRLFEYQVLDMAMIFTSRMFNSELDNYWLKEGVSTVDRILNELSKEESKDKMEITARQDLFSHLFSALHAILLSL